MSSKETDARIRIDKMLLESGWKLPGWHKDKEINVKTEIKNEHGEADYVLLNSKGFFLCTVEAKNSSKSPLVGKEKSREYAQSLRSRFIILSNGIKHYLWDTKLGNPHLIDRLPTQKYLELRGESFNPPRDEDEDVNDDYLTLTQFPEYKKNPDFNNEDKKESFIKKNKLKFLRDYQVKAIQAIKDKIKNGGDRFLLEMATGTGKTNTSAGIIKMFLRLYKVKRVLFLVDRLELETQAKKEFEEVLKNDFKTVIWKENKDDWRKAEIVISTVQSFTKHNKYKRIFQPNDFDFVISDEAHRSLGLRSRNVFEYFVGFKLGLTATPRDFLKSVDADNMSVSDPKQLERRLILDTYTIFGCEDGEPTFKYTLADGVRDGFLVNPTVIDVETGLSAEMMKEEGLSFKGVDEDGNDVEEEVFTKKDYEKRFKSHETNLSFCNAFIKNASLDPFTGEIGKTLIFCVSQNHAERITQILNELAEGKFPNRYNSDFAVQVTSSVDSMNPQQMTVDFSNNNLLGNSPLNPLYKTSKARVCITVAMMTTGYDCRDILNICLMRPVFSPSEFIQMKGRGTRIFDFTECWISKNDIPEIDYPEKQSFKLFDYFHNYHYFENEFNYDEKLKLPEPRKIPPTPPPPPPNDLVYNLEKDPVKKTEEIFIPQAGMRIDRELYKSFKDRVVNDEVLKKFVEKQEFNKADEYLKQNILNKSETKFSLDKLRKSLGLDINISIKELLLYAFGFIDKIKSKDEIILDEHEKLDDKFKFKDNEFYESKQVLEAYVTDKSFREIIDNKKFAELNTHPSGEFFKKLSPEVREKLPSYIKENIDINRFIDA